MEADNGESETTVENRPPTGRPLHFLEGPLFGRHEEAQYLIEAYDHRILSTERQIVLITGPSGTGKTRLAQHLREHAERSGGMVISGKFDQLRCPKPFSAFVAAFTDFSNQILLKGEAAVVWVRSEVNRSGDIDTSVLIGMIPALASILAEDSSDSSEGDPLQLLSELQRQRFLIVFANFIRAICSPEHPCVLFLDDLQWADVGSLALLHRLVCNGQRYQGAMILGACRGNEVQIHDPLADMLRSLEDDNGVRITNIVLTNFTKEATNDLVAVSLERNKEDCESLSDVVYHLTNGNIFFTKQYIQSLHKNAIIFFDEKEGQWVWYEHRLHLSSLTSMEFLAETLQDLLPAPMHQELLKVASSLGAVFTADTLFVLLAHNVVESGIKEAVDASIIVQVPNKAELGWYRFAHDQLQRAAYDLIPDEHKKYFHLRIARTLTEKLTELELVDRLYLVVGQFAFGHELINDKFEREYVATLCLKAGQKAILSSAFHAGSSYFKLGIDILGERCWRDHYSLCLSLHDAAAESCYCNADLTGMEVCIEAILRHATTYLAKLTAYSTKILSLGGSMKLHEAVELGLEVLKKLNERIATPSPFYVIREYVKTKWLLRRVTKKEILDLRLMTDGEKLGAMRIVNVLYAYSFLGRPEYVALLTMKGVQLTLKYGLSASSAPAIAAYAMLHCSGLGTIAEGHEFGQLSLQILQKFKSKAWIPRVHTLMYGLVAYCRDPIQTCVQPLYNGYKIGLATGDVEFAFMSAAMYSFVCLFAGKPLPEFVEEMTSFRENMLALKQAAVLALFNSVVQMCSNLLGHSQDPFVLTGEFMNEDDELHSIRACNNGTAETSLELCHTWIAIYMGDPDKAEKFGIATRTANITMQFSLGRITQYFLDGMAASMAARAIQVTKRRLRTIRQCTKALNKIATLAPFNFLHLVCVLEAEMAMLQGNLNKAKLKYRMSIDLALKGKYIHHLGLCYDRLAFTLREHGEHPTAMENYIKSRDAFASWGAKVKVDQLNAMIEVYTISVQ